MNATVASWQKKLNKWFPKHRDMTEKQLKKERRGYYVMQGLWLFFLVFFVAAFALNPYKPTSFEGLALLALPFTGIAMSAAMYAQYRVLESEVNFELRLREAVAQAKT